MINILSSFSRDAGSEKTALVESSHVETGPSKRQPSITESNGSNYLEMYSYDACIARESYTVLAVRRTSGRKILEEGIDGKQTISYFQLSSGNNFTRSTSYREVRCYEGLKESSLWQLLR